MTSSTPGRVWSSASLSATALLCIALAACTSPGDDSVEVNILEGTISGTLLDSNGAPIVGASVEYDEPDDGKAQISTLTDDTGAFALTDVGIVAASGPDGNDANGPILLTVTPPAGPETLGAVISLSPAAQAGAAAQNELFGDGYNIDAGDIRIPRLDKVIQGTARNAATGAPVPEVQIALSFLDIQFDPQLQSGVSVEYRSDTNLIAKTGSDGAFSFDAAANDSCLQMLIAGLSIDSISGSAADCQLGTPDTRDPDALYLATATDPDLVNLGSVFVSGFVNSDNVAPVVASIPGVLDASVSPAPLQSGVTGAAPSGLQLRFSEPMQDVIAAGDVAVTYGAGEQQVTATVRSATLTDNTLLTIILSAALPQGETVSVHLLRESFLDLAGNTIGLSSAIAYDTLTSNNQILTLQLNTYADLDVTPPFVAYVEGVQNALANPAPLAAGIDGVTPNELVVVFSESVIDRIGAADVSVRLPSGIPEDVASVELTDGGTRLHVALVDALPAGTPVSVRLVRSEVSDPAGNGVALNGGIEYDAFTGSDNSLLSLSLITSSTP